MVSPDGDIAVIGSSWNYLFGEIFLMDVVNQACQYFSQFIQLAEKLYCICAWLFGDLQVKSFSFSSKRIRPREVKGPTGPLLRPPSPPPIKSRVENWNARSSWLFYSPPPPVVCTNIYSVTILWKALYKPSGNAKLKNKAPKEASNIDKYRSKLQGRVR